MQMTRRSAGRLLGAATLCAALCTAGSPMAAAGGSVAPAATPTVAQLVGQRLVVAFKGTTASSSLKRRIREGQIGGVILFGQNISSPSQLKALTTSLRHAAHTGGQPRLLIMTDQEGGLVRRLPWAPPKRSALELGQLSGTRIQQIGAQTGTALRKSGVNIDLAPVADVPRGSRDFIQQQQRAFSTSRFAVARDAPAFAKGLEAAHVWPALKHFPGLGLAKQSTDVALVRINAGARTLRRSWLPYKYAFRQGLDPMVMLSTAVYPNLARHAPAWSSAIINGDLRGRLGFQGVTITDSLDAAAAVRHTNDSRLALNSAGAGCDLLLITGSGRTSRAVYNDLLAAAKSGELPMSNLQASYARITALKSTL
jgi:beta-N-acetylhexosaminidase